MKLRPIGIVHSPFKSAAGTPIQPRFARGAEGRVEIREEFVPGLRDLRGFDRIWLLYWFDRAAPAEPGMLVKPYLDRHTRGLFATRAPARPNPIGMSCVRLKKVRGNILTIGDVDILDGTPLLDIKPYVPDFDVFAVGRTGWFSKAEGKRRVADDRFESKARK